MHPLEIKDLSQIKENFSFRMYTNSELRPYVYNIKKDLFIDWINTNVSGGGSEIGGLSFNTNTRVLELFDPLDNTLASTTITDISMASQDLDITGDRAIDISGSFLTFGLTGDYWVSGFDNVLFDFGNSIAFIGGGGSLNITSGSPISIDNPLGLKVPETTEATAANVRGNIIFDSGTNTFKGFNGTTWVTL